MRILVGINMLDRLIAISIDQIVTITLCDSRVLVICRDGATEELKINPRWTPTTCNVEFMALLNSIANGTISIHITDDGMFELGTFKGVR